MIRGFVIGQAQAVVMLPLSCEPRMLSGDQFQEETAACRRAGLFGWSTHSAPPPSPGLRRTADPDGGTGKWELIRHRSLPLFQVEPAT